MIKPKDKPCKGTTPDTKGLGCGKPTKHRAYGLGKMCGCYSHWLLNTEAGRIKLNKATLKATKPRKEFEKAKKTEKETKSLASLLINVRTECHNYIKLRDRGKPCGSCGAIWNDSYQAGHVFKAELYSTIKFNELNIHGQCRKCNLRKDGNKDGYMALLPKRLGVEKFNELIRLSEEDKIHSFKWDRDQLAEIREHYKEKIKELKQ